MATEPAPTATFRGRVDRELSAGERQGATYLAISPDRDPGTAFLPYAAVPLLWLWHRVADRRSHEEVLSSSGFPVARRMLLVATDQRLLIWSARRGFRPGRLIGEVPLSRIRTAASPTVGQGWRTVSIELTDAKPVSVMVPAKDLESFIGDVTAAQRR